MPLEPFIALNQPDISRLRTQFEEPVHSDSLRAPSAIFSGRGADLSRGVILRLDGWNSNPELELLIADFRNFLTNVMDVPDGSYLIECRRTNLPELPANTVERCRRKVSSETCLIEAEDIAGLRRALFNLEEEMTMLRFPEIPVGEESDYTFEKVRISRSPMDTYRFGGGWELNRDEEFYPDEYLNGLAHCRVNGIWVAGLFREILYSEVLPELCTEVEPQALERLNKLTERAANYGIKVYLFCMEPRSLKPGHPVFAAHPELLGTVCGEGDLLGVGTLCFEEQRVRDYLRESLTGLWNAAPKLGGMIQIFAGERATSCRSIDDYIGDGTLCPRCARLTQGEALSRIIRFQTEVLREVAPDARYLVWSYGLPRRAQTTKEYIYQNIGREVVWLENFEHYLTKEFFAHTIINEEYSLSLTGPSETFSAMHKLAKPESPEVWPKLQFGTTYEFGNLPFMPTPAAAFRKSCGEYGGAFLSWIIGGWPDLMLKAFGMTTGANHHTEKEFLHRLAAFYYGENQADQVAAAWKIFAEALELYPCDKDIFYYGPLPRSPGYRLLLTGGETLPAHTYNWGIDRNRKQQACYTSVPKWSGAFHPEELSMLFRRLAARWNDGLEILRRIPATRTTSRQLAAAEAVQVMTESAANVYDFYRLRSNFRDPETARQLVALAESEITLARRMMELLRVDARIGFQSEIYFYGSSPEFVGSWPKIAFDRDTAGSSFSKVLNPA